MPGLERDVSSAQSLQRRGPRVRTQHRPRRDVTIDAPILLGETFRAKTETPQVSYPVVHRSRTPFIGRCRRPGGSDSRGEICMRRVLLPVSVAVLAAAAFTGPATAGGILRIKSLNCIPSLTCGFGRMPPLTCIFLYRVFPAVFCGGAGSTLFTEGRSCTPGLCVKVRMLD